MKEYTEAFKATMIRKMTGPRARTAADLAKEVGVHQTTLSRWLRQAGIVVGMSDPKRDPRPQATPPKRTQDWTPAEKLQVVAEAADLAEGEVGAFLRRKGLHRAQLEEWRKLTEAALEGDTPKRGRKKRGPTPEQKRIRQLEQQLRRKEKALAEAAALLVLKKKFEEAFGDEESDTDPRSDE